MLPSLALFQPAGPLLSQFITNTNRVVETNRSELVVTSYLASVLLHENKGPSKRKREMEMGGDEAVGWTGTGNNNGRCLAMRCCPLLKMRKMSKIPSP
jgi:hypothetical protein